VYEANFRMFYAQRRVTFLVFRCSYLYFSRSYICVA